MPPIGEGTYGCVHKPSLKCKGKPMSYKGKISKIMRANEADKELQEYAKIKLIDDTNQFYQGEPVECEPVDDVKTRAEIDKCSSVSSKDIADYKLLIMEDGGLDLSKYISVATKSRKSINRFWTEARRVILGVSVLVTNGAVHHDLKPQNMVYFEKTHRMNFIDFGLMTTTDKIRDGYNRSNYGLAILHATFPFEMSFMKKRDYMVISKQRDLYAPALVKRILVSPQNMFFANITHGKHKQSREQVLKFITEQYSKMITEDITPDNYDKIMEKSINTIDVYGLGFTFLFMLGHFRPYMDSHFADDLDDLFLEAIHPRVMMRLTADELLSKYDAILQKHLSGESPQDRCMRTGKEYNPFTKRCTVKCKEGQTRNDKFRCVGCTSDKEMNPKTNRCTKKCRPGYERNDQFKCLRITP
jgi:serine/threonine protein kinase